MFLSSFEHARGIILSWSYHTSSLFDHQHRGMSILERWISGLAHLLSTCLYMLDDVLHSGKMLVLMRQYNVPSEKLRMQDTYGIWWILHSGKMLRYHLLTGLNRDKRFIGILILMYSYSLHLKCQGFRLRRIWYSSHNIWNKPLYEYARELLADS